MTNPANVRELRTAWLRVKSEVAYVRMMLAARLLLETLRREAKYSPNQPRLPSGQTGDGQWTSGEGGSSTLTGGAGNDRLGRPYNILEEDMLGGHTFARHVGKSEEYLKARVLNNRINIPFVGEIGEKRAGSFASLEAANKLVNSVMAEPQNQEKLNAFVEGRLEYMLPVLYLYPAAPFNSPTGYEAYVPNERSQPVIRPTNSLEIRVFRTDGNTRGYYINSAYPLNED